MNRIDRIARKIVAANMFFDRKEWKEFHKKVTDSHRYFGRNKASFQRWWNDKGKS